MDNVIIKNAQGEQVNVNVVRYFKLNGSEYLVFSLNEIDEGGYVKLYISKVDGNIASAITDDVEWNLIKDTIKTIIKSNKENVSLSITDIDARKLNNIQISGQKVFKLSETFIQLLSANKNVEPYIEATANLSLSDSNVVASEIDVNAIQQNPIIQNDFVQSMESNIQDNVQPQVAPYLDVVPTAVNDDNNQDVNESPVLENIQSIVANLEVPQAYDVPVGNTLGNNNEDTVDYKMLYENEVSKNNMLTEELEKYKSIINSIKNTINQ